MATSLNIKPNFVPTKRGIISDIAKTFDILGWISPCIITMKVLYQRLWELELDWDDAIPQELQVEHNTWREQLSVLSSKSLPRCYFRVDSPYTNIELHGFSDASEKAYAAVVYLRATYSEHSPTVSLIVSKTKVAPVKPQTIPRLELCGATLLTKLMSTVSKALNIPTEQCHAWCDSTIVLNWLDGNPKRYRTFVGNRISTILKALPPESWKHVPTLENPADCASRGLLPNELVKHSLWWEGPPWLRSDPILTPSQPLSSPFSTPELKVVTCNFNAPVPPEWIESKYSSFHQLLCVTAWCKRFCQNLQSTLQKKPKITSPHLFASEINQAEILTLKRSQKRSFPIEVHQLQTDKELKSASKILSLTPILDKYGLIRVGGRLANTNLTWAQTHPVILSGKDQMVKSMFSYKHLCLDHCGPSLLLSALGHRFHVVGARKLARTTCKSCTVCRRLSAQSQPQRMGQLPAPRVTPSHTFSVTGVDYAGPFTLKTGSIRKPTYVKAYLCLFVCFSTKAVHLEIISDLTTEALLAGIKRFVSRRGLPKEFHSDNGTNFVGAKNDLQALYKLLKEDTTTAALNKYLLKQRVQWKCIPERSPHFGGLWESAVKSAKYHLRRVVGTQRLTYEELSTVTCQVEGCLNSRPLTVITSHSMDGIEPLTPGHFLLGRTPTAYPETVIHDEPSYYRRWTLCQALVHHFWRRWSSEYLHSLQSLPKWKRLSPTLKVGDVVVIRDAAKFTCQWPLAKVIEVFPGQDNLVRVATVKTSTSTLKRPVSKLALIHREGQPQDSIQDISQEHQDLPSDVFAGENVQTPTP